MSKIILDEFPKEPKECPFCEVETHYYNNEKYYMCHLREGIDLNCNYALRECIGCDKCKKITSL